MAARNPTADDKNDRKYSAAVVCRQDNAQESNREVICGPTYGKSRDEALSRLLDMMEEQAWGVLHPGPAEQPQRDQMDGSGGGTNEPANRRRNPNERTGLTGKVGGMGI
ncbi:uncharacterized protein BDZ99DRAFT_514233 [Mytilinidion resinicola]|uniref:Uncharacterized protein n=1 Tax=Mytilinidion resinicola TaxID=574789 RepID=A0A6A6ZAF8_9PEZI|nr:uncharacterized protein BDZ99DRAFT_514233 [Mytilinidion resinicola]KAF2818010.1 hypothetical protein BDZ99DRAFT_514233 [Mytilinidion resinicola]